MRLIPTSPAGPAPRRPASGTQRRRLRFVWPLARFVWPLALGVSAFAGGAISARLGQAAPGHSPYSLVDQLARVLVLIENEYVDAVDRQRLLQGAIKGMVAELDPHSAYLDAEAFKELQVGTQGEFGGLGIEVGMEDGFVKVISPIEDTPAFRAGVKAGDLIVKLDDTRRADVARHRAFADRLRLDSGALDLAGRDPDARAVFGLALVDRDVVHPH